MKVLVVGLGSMGKRRIRNLLAIGGFDIFGFDLRKDRIEEVSKLYSISVSQNFDELIRNHKFDSLIISVPPDLHHLYIRKSLELQLPCFVEASVVNTDLHDLNQISLNSNIFVAPSTTLRFHPAIKLIRQFIKEGFLGETTNVLYHSGQYLPDWHTYEKVEDYYVSNPETGGAREIVPFELTWMVEIFGFPTYVLGLNKKTIQIDGAEQIDDTYNALLDYDTFIVNLTVDVVSRFATRNLVINGSKKQLKWDWNDTFVKVFDPETQLWAFYEYEVIEAQEGYNKNITEQMYIDELIQYFQSIAGKLPYSNSLDNDLKVLNVLYMIEKSSKEKIFIKL